MEDAAPRSDDTDMRATRRLWRQRAMAAVADSLDGASAGEQSEMLECMSPEQRAASFAAMESPEREQRWEGLSPEQRGETLDAMVLESRVSIAEALGAAQCGESLSEMCLEPRLETLAAMGPLRRKAALLMLPEARRIETLVAVEFEAVGGMSRLERCEKLLDEELEPAVTLGLICALPQHPRRESFAMMSGAQRQSLFQGLGPEESSCLLEMLTPKHRAEFVARLGANKTGGIEAFGEIFRGLGQETQRLLLAATEPSLRHSLLEASAPRTLPGRPHAAVTVNKTRVTLKPTRNPNVCFVLEAMPGNRKEAAMCLLTPEDRHTAVFASMVAWSKLEWKDLGGLLEDGEVLAAVEGTTEKAALLGALSPEERGALLAGVPAEEVSQIMAQMPIPGNEKDYTTAVMLTSLAPNFREGALMRLTPEQRISALGMMAPDDASQALMCLNELDRLSILRKMRPEARLGPIEAMSEANRKATLECFHVDDRVKHRIAKLNARGRALGAAEAGQQRCAGAPGVTRQRDFVP